MRSLFGCLAVLLGAVSIALAARYGYKGADTEVDGAISGVVFGLIALCAFLFDAAAVRLWFMRFRVGALLIGAIAAAALLVTFTNSLGAIAGRADTTLAERMRAKDDVATDRAELARITKERGALAAFTPATEEDVTAARDAVRAAELVRIAECERRGPRCRERETEEQTKRESLAAVLASKALTVKSGKLDADAAVVRGRIAKAPSVQNANPLEAVLQQLVGAGAVALTAWQQAVIAAVFELCLVGVMVIFELLGQSHATVLAEQRKMGVVELLTPVAAPPRTPTGLHSRETSGRTGPRRTPSAPPVERNCSKGSVRAFALECLLPADGGSVEVKALLLEYRTWCEQHDLEPEVLAGFAEDMREVCAKAGIAIETKGKRVLCRNVRLAEKPARAPTEQEPLAIRSGAPSHLVQRQIS